MTNFPIPNQRIIYGRNRIYNRKNEPYTVIGYNAAGKLVVEDCNGKLSSQKGLKYHSLKRHLHVVRECSGRCYLSDTEQDFIFCNSDAIPITLRVAEHLVGQKIDSGECIKLTIERTNND